MQNEIINKKFNMLTILEYFGKDKYSKDIYKCKCDCGKEKNVRLYLLIKEKIKSCGCYNLKRVKLPRKNGYTRTIKGKTTRIYNIYNNMKQRCYNKNHHKYNVYGKRGIKICDEWLGENGYKNFSEWALNNGYSEDLTIDRKNNDGNYEPLNCRWTDVKTQNKNRKASKNFEIEGLIKNRKDWCEMLGLNYEKTRKIKPLEKQKEFILKKYLEVKNNEH